MKDINYENFLATVKFPDEVSPQIFKAFKNLCMLNTSWYVETIDEKIEYRGDCTILSIYDNIKFTYRLGLDFQTLKKLEKLGFIKVTMFGFKKNINAEIYPLSHFVYGDNVFSIYGYKSNHLTVGNIMLTELGNGMAQKFDFCYNDEYPDILKKFFNKDDQRLYEKPLLEAKCSGNCFSFVKINRDEYVFKVTENLLKYRQSSYPKKA